MDQGWKRFVATVRNQTLLADAGDFFSLEGGATPYRILEVRVWQTGTTTLTMDAIILRRGVIPTPGGGALTEDEYTTSGPASVTTARTLPTDDVGSADWEYSMGWNLLQEAHFLPIPGLWLPVAANFDFGITRASTTAHTGVGVTVVWEEFIGT